MVIGIGVFLNILSPSGFRNDNQGFELDPQRSVRGGFFRSREEPTNMANHLTPEELSQELGLEPQDVIKVCLEEGVPIYHGKIDKYLFQTQLQATAQAHAA